MVRRTRGPRQLGDHLVPVRRAQRVEQPREQRGIFQIVSKRSDGDERTFYGRFHTYARRTDGGWRICADYDTDERSATLEEDFLAGIDVDDVEAFGAQDVTRA